MLGLGFRIQGLGLRKGFSSRSGCLLESIVYKREYNLFGGSIMSTLTFGNYHLEVEGLGFRVCGSGGLDSGIQWGWGISRVDGLRFQV